MVLSKGTFKWVMASIEMAFLAWDCESRIFCICKIILWCYDVRNLLVVGHMERRWI